MLNVPRTPDTVILANSLRLYRDAKALLADGRFPSAVTLSILAIEEFGKFLNFVGLIESDVNRNLHLHKQSWVSNYYISIAYRITLLDVLGIHGKVTIDRRLVIPEEQMAILKPYLECDESNMDMEVFEKVLYSDPFHNALITFSRYHRRDLNKLKNKSLYVDTDGKEIKNDPSDITKDMAEDIMKSAKQIYECFRKATS